MSTTSKSATKLPDDDYCALDMHLAKGEFLDRLILVRSNPLHTDTPTASTSGENVSINAVAAYKLWPAIKFDSYHQLNEAIKDDLDIPEVKTLRIKIFLQHNKLKADAGKDPGVAYLLGKSKAGTSLVLLPKGADDKNVFDFFDHVADIDNDEEYCGSSDFRLAYDIAVKRMEEEFEDLKSCASKEINENRWTESAEPQPSTLISKKTSVFDVEDAPDINTLCMSPRLKRHAKKNRNESNQEECKVEENKRTVKRESEGVPVKKIEVDGKNEDLSSLESPSPVRSSRMIAIPNLAAENSLTSTSIMEWRDMWKYMKENGWRHMAGGGLVSYYYVNATCKGLKRTEIFKHGKEGLDYFSSEEEVRQFARDHLGWKAPSRHDATSADTESTSQGQRTEKTEDDLDAEAKEGKKEGEDRCSSTKSAHRSSIRSENDRDKRNGTPRRSLQKPQAKSPVMEWTDMWNEMRREGWTYTKGTDLVAWYYIKPEFAKMGKTQLMKTTTEGEGFFTSEKDVQKYAQQFLGWKGETETSPQYTDVTKRVKMRGRRTNTISDSILDSTKSSINNELKNKKPSSGNQMTRNTPTSRATPAPLQSETPIGSNSSNSSRFSDCDSASQPKSNLHTKTSQLRSYRKTSTFTGVSDTSEIIIKKPRGRPQKMYSTANTNLLPTTSKIHPNVSSNNASPNSSQQSSLDESFQLIKNADAWELLKSSFGFLYDSSNNAYCLPGNENMPSKNPSAEKGVNYFETLQDLRHNLCAYGMPECNRRSTSPKFDHWAQIDNWLKYAHVTGLSDGAVIDQSDLGEPITFKTAWSLLKKFGMKYSSSGYVIPPSHPCGKTWKFERQENFLEHLARFGLPSPDGVAKEKVTAEERMKLDFYIADTRVDRSVRNKIASSVMVELSPLRRKTRFGDASHLKLGMGTAKESQGPQLTAVPLRKNEHRTRDLHSEQPAIHRNFGGEKVITSEEALRLLETHFDLSTRDVDGVAHYCLPRINPKQNSTLNVNYFSNVKDLRCNLCAFGFPSSNIVKITEKSKISLEVWVRSAIISEFCEESFEIPDHFAMETNEAWKTLKRLGYKLSKNNGTYYLPGVVKHTSITGKDCFESIFSLFDHISRFGLITSHEDPESDCEVSSSDMLRLGVFILHVGTFDIWDRHDETTLNCEKEFATKLPLTLAASSKIDVRRDTVLSEAVTKFPATSTTVANVAKCTNQPGNDMHAEGAPSVIYDDSDQDSLPSPKKKQKVSATLDKYFHQESFNNRLQQSPCDSSVNDRSIQGSCVSGLLSPSCLLEKGDEEVEACFADSKPASPTVTVPVQPDEKLSSPVKNSNQLEDGIKNSGPTNSTIAEANGMQPKRQLKSEFQIEGSPAKKPKPSMHTEERETAGIHTHHDEMKNDIPQCFGDKETTVRGKLEASLIALHQSYKAKKHLAKVSADSQLSRLEESINDFMRRSILTGTTIDGMHCRSPSFMYICGAPGTGKTTTVEACSKNMTKWAKKNGHDKPVFCFINMAAAHSSLGNKGNLMRSTLSKITRALGMEEGSKLNHIEKVLRKKVLILIIDEVDMLFTNHGGVGETWFKSLISICEDDEVCLSMIGISNSINDASAARIRNLANSPEEIVFPSYTELDLLAILQQRVGKKIIDTKALELISRKIATTSGDARRVLELTYNAVNICLESSSEEELLQQLPDDHEPLVKVSHIMKALRQAMPGRHDDVIRGLPQAAKVVLCIAVTISQVWGPKAEISVATLKKFCVEASMHAIMDELGISQVMYLVETLSDAGLLIIGNNGFFNPSESDMKLKLGVQLDDVETALERSLLTEPFYRRLVDFVKNKCPAPPN